MNTDDPGDYEIRKGCFSIQVKHKVTDIGVISRISLLEGIRVKYKVRGWIKKFWN